MKNVSKLTSFGKMIGYFVFIFLCCALLAPWVYGLMQRSVDVFPIFKSLADQPFHRYLNRSFLLLAVLGLWPLLRSLGIQSWRELGLGKVPGLWRKFGNGFLFGFGSLAIIAVLFVVFGKRRLNVNLPWMDLSRHIVKTLLAGCIVAVIEETICRGTIFGGLRKVVYWLVALILSSLIFSAVHFIHQPVFTGPVHWATGLVLLPQLVCGVGNSNYFGPMMFLNLILVGLILGWMYQTTGSLYFSIGLHGGWIFWAKSFAFLTNEVSGPRDWFWGSGKLIDGCLAFIVLGFVLLIFCRKTGKPSGGFVEKFKAFNALVK